MLRPARADDADWLLAWRNDPAIVALGRSQRAVAPEEHARWFAGTLAGAERLLFIVEHEGERIGQVRFDRIDEVEAEVSIFLLPAWTGRGRGVPALQEACAALFARWPVEVVVARVRPENEASLRAFARAGFAERERAEVVTFERRRPVRVPHNRLTFGPEEEEAVRAAVGSGYWAGGPRLAALERELAARAGVAHAVGVGSGLAALRLTLRAFGVGPGDEVIVPAYSCVALANAALALGAVAVPTDVREADWNLDLAAVRRALTPRTRAIVAVHTFGAPADVAGLRALGPPVLEDCAHAFGRPGLGSAGQAAVLSFYATKLMGAGEGGAVLTDDAAVATRVREWRDYSDRAADALALNDKMNDLEAALAGAQLRRLPDLLAARDRLAGRYHERLAGLEASGVLSRPAPSPQRVWYRYVVDLHRHGAPELVQALRRHGVAAEQPVTDWRRPTDPQSPVADHAFQRLLSLPLYPTLTDDEQDDVVRALEAALVGR